MLEASTESREEIKAAKERSDQRLTVAQEDVKMLKSMISTLQVELAGVYVCACVCVCARVCVCVCVRARESART